MSTNIFFVRHGQVHNPTGIYYGRLPRIYLSDTGKRQIEQSALFLKNKQIDLLVVSPMLRAKQSAQIIAEALQLKTVKRSRLITEIGSYLEGKSFEESKTLHFNPFLSEHQREQDESFNRVAIRMTRFVKKMFYTYPGKNIVAVSHGDPLMILKATIENLPPTIESIRPGKNLYISYGEVFHVTQDSKTTLSIQSVFTPISYNPQLKQSL